MPRGLLIFLSKYMLCQSEFVKKKPSVNRAAKILQPNNHFLSDLLKNPKGVPFYVKKFFISDFDETQNLIYLGPKNSTHEI